MQRPHHLPLRQMRSALDDTTCTPWTDLDLHLDQAGWQMQAHIAQRKRRCQHLLADKLHRPLRPIGPRAKPLCGYTMLCTPAWRTRTHPRT